MSSTTFDITGASFWDTQAEQLNTDYVVQFLGYYAKEMIKMSQIDVKIKERRLKGDQLPLQVLDVACGTGLVANMVARQFNQEEDSLQISGIDYSPVMIKKAIEKSQDLSNVNYQVMDGQNLTFPDESFDILYSLMGVIFYPDLPKGLKEIYRVLKKNGGCAVIAGWTEKIPTQILVDTLEKVTGGDSSLSSSLPFNPDSPTFRLKDEHVFAKLLQDAGFTSYEIKYVPCVLEEPRDTMIQLLKHYANAITWAKQQDEKFFEAMNQVVDSCTNEKGISRCESVAVIGIAYK